MRCSKCIYGHPTSADNLRTHSKAPQHLYNKMQLLSLTALALLATTYVFAQDFDDLDNDDIPAQCSLVCSNIVAVANTCDRSFDDDHAELNCVCMADNAAIVVPLCASCVLSVRDERNDDDGDDDNDDADNGKTPLPLACSMLQEYSLLLRRHRRIAPRLRLSNNQI
jgi:hypothetical protein